MRLQLCATTLALAGFMSEAHAASVVAVSPAMPHPSQTIALSGSGFGDSEAIDVYFDTTDTLLLVTSSTGTFSASLTVPASAAPGIHYATVIGRHSGDAAQIAMTVTTPWVEFGYGAAHRGWNPYENTLSTSNVDTLGPLWTASTNPDLGGLSVIGGKVFTAGAAGIQALSTTTGAVLWTSDKNDAFYVTPAVAAGIVYAGSASSDSFYAVAAANGAAKWTATLGSTTRSSPVVVGNIVYIGCNDDKLYAFNAATGALIWTYTTGGEIASSPAVVDGIVYVGSTDDNLYALNASTGALLWSFATGNQIYSSPAVANGVVYIGSYDDKLYAIAAGTTGGSQLWSATTSGFIYSSPAVARNRVVVGSGDDNVYEFDARTGAENWAVNTGDQVLGTPAIANGVVYVGNGSGTLLAIDLLYGEVLASLNTKPYIIAAPAISDGILYVNGEYHETYAYALQAGNNAIPRRVQAPKLSSLHPDRRLVVTR